MKRFRWGDVVPTPRPESAPTDDPPTDLGLHRLAVHGLLVTDPWDVEAVHLRLSAAD